MKKIIGIILLILVFALIWGGLFSIFYTGGVNFMWSIFLPFGCLLVSAIVGLIIELIQWLLS